MLAKINNLYTRLAKLFKIDLGTPQVMRPRLTVILLLSDLLNIGYIDQVFLRSDKINNMMMNSLALSGYKYEEISTELMLEMHGAFVSTFWVFLALFLLNNSIFYFFFYKDRPAGIKFVRGYVKFGLLLSLLNCFTPNTSNFFWIAPIIMTTMAYLYAEVALKYFFPKKTE